MRRTFAVIALAISAVLLVPAAALGSGAGEGLAGETNDKVVTFFSFGVIGFFVILVCVGTVIQSRLERRKEARKAAELRQRTGW
jgi:Na+/melibiose symporter-like transporter